MWNTKLRKSRGPPRDQSKCIAENEFQAFQPTPSKPPTQVVSEDRSLHLEDGPENTLWLFIIMLGDYLYHSPILSSCLNIANHPDRAQGASGHLVNSSRFLVHISWGTTDTGSDFPWKYYYYIRGAWGILPTVTWETDPGSTLLPGGKQRNIFKNFLNGTQLYINSSLYSNDPQGLCWVNFYGYTWELNYQVVPVGKQVPSYK